MPPPSLPPTLQGEHHQLAGTDESFLMRGVMDLNHHSADSGNFRRTQLRSTASCLAPVLLLAAVAASYKPRCWDRLRLASSGVKHIPLTAAHLQDMEPHLTCLGCQPSEGTLERVCNPPVARLMQVI